MSDYFIGIGIKTIFCPEPCGEMLACEHKCVGKCWECRAGKLHVACGEKCERQLICSHVSLLNKKKLFLFSYLK
jgi:hypothetical protein